MLETISETKTLKAPLPPRGPKNPTGIKPVQTKYKKSGSYGDDQDPSYTDSSEDYAKSYYAIQSKKHAEAASPKCGASPSSTAGSEHSETFVCDMTSANEPLYGDPGEEESYQY